MFAVVPQHERMIATTPKVLKVSQKGQSTMRMKKEPAFHQHASTQDKYKARFKRLRKTVKHMIFTNAAICDEVVRLEEKVAKAKQERKFLLKRLLQHQAVREGQIATIGTGVAGVAAQVKVTAGASGPTGHPGEKGKAKKRIAEKKRSLLHKETTEGNKAKPKKPTQKASSLSKKLVQPIPLDSSGRPVFPIVLGDLTVHSIGEVMTDNPSYHSAESIYPIGYCSTRVYASISNPSQRCMYTCKISDDGENPMFEISPDDKPAQVFTGATPTECHQKLLHLVNSARGAPMVNASVDKGAQFFGLTQPCVQNLIQSCPGARKCSGYKWVKFEIAKANTSVIHNEDDPSISFDALQRSVGFQQSRMQASQMKSAPTTPNMPNAVSTPEVSASLRSLLTSVQYMSGLQQQE